MYEVAAACTEQTEKKKNGTKMNVRIQEKKKNHRNRETNVDARLRYKSKSVYLSR